MKAAKILLVEDNPADVDLVIEAFEDAKFNNKIDVAEDGILAMEYLRKEGEFADAEEPDIILLDINLPRKNGLEVLKEVKTDETLRHIPVVMLTTSDSPDDIETSYKEHTNAFITKPVDVEKFLEIGKQLKDFWFCVVKLPKT